MQEKKVPFTLTQILSKLKGADNPWVYMGMDQLGHPTRRIPWN